MVQHTHGFICFEGRLFRSGFRATVLAATVFWGPSILTHVPNMQVLGVSIPPPPPKKQRKEISTLKHPPPKTNYSSTDPRWRKTCRRLYTSTSNSTPSSIPSCMPCQSCKNAPAPSPACPLAPSFQSHSTSNSALNSTYTSTPNCPPLTPAHQSRKSFSPRS